MKRWIVLVAGLLLAFQALAMDSMRFGSKVITVGDSEEKVVAVAGKPESRTEVQNVYGAVVAYRLDYLQDNKTVQIYIANGQVADIKEIFN
ncbi:DUF2845 domain-containing protein [Rhodanobacter sp. DHG33]|uniref:DUF2845 domain-containing protein n=1 Tax=Rhodanobacter sp. DHG33 TaxID=2775921 RepID=UPI001781EC86|nr:DUF2845 domain-containing protein [Rhodanobacter sp. DHG33]MBD8898601.1 DUF2845 domain-containing protein [Rhodanobacter sp. DHG33]